MNSVVVIGTGNVSHHLCKGILENKNLKLLKVYGRNYKNLGLKLSNELFSKNFDDIIKADFYFIIVSDDSILEISNKIMPDQGSVVVHFSGSTDMNILSKHINYGVIYPLQTFSKKRVIDLNDVPLLIEGSSKTALKKIKKISLLLSKNVSICNTKKRSIVHLSAVFCNNFSNYMNLIAEELLKREKIDPKILVPLISETSKKLKHLTAINAQTGPALRGDHITIKKHLDLLKNSKYFDIYKNISQMIQKSNK